MLAARLAFRLADRQAIGSTGHRTRAGVSDPHRRRRPVRPPGTEERREPMSVLESRVLQVWVKLPAGGTKPILAGVDLIVRSGETHAIMGPNGSGKSTLARAVGRSEEHTSELQSRGHLVCRL